MDASRPKLGGWNLNIAILRWVAIVLPILVLVVVDIIRHMFLPQQLHTLPGFMATYAIMIAGVVLFSYVMFDLVSRLQYQVREHNRRLSAINAIATALAKDLHLEEVLATGLEHTLKVMKADAGLICLVDMEHEEHTAVCHHGLSPEIVQGIKRAKLRDDPIASEVVRTKRPVIMERVFEDPRVAELAKREGIRSAISVPLHSEGEVTGILALATRTERHFTQADKDFLAPISGQLGLAIRNGLLFDHSERRNRELAALGAIGKAVTSSLDLNEILTKALDTVLDVSGSDAAEIWLADDDGLYMWGHRGAHSEAFLERTRFDLGQGIPGIVAQTQAPIVVHDLEKDDRFLRGEVAKSGYHTFCALPLSYRSQSVGVLAVAALSPEAIRGQRELRLLEEIGERIAPAIVNAKLHEQVQLLATQQERERIAREMHDGMAQVVAYMGAQTLAVKKLLSDGRNADAMAELVRMQETVQELYADVREGILGLRTATAGSRGLVAVLKDYVDRYQDGSGVQVQFRVSPGAEDDVHLSPFAELQLIRIVQEALSNVRKHAKATSVTVGLSREGNDLQVEVSDNGQGFDPSHLPSTGWPRFGLQTMRERAEAVGGGFSIDAGREKGTRVKVQIPIIGGDGRRSSHEGASS